MNHSKLASGLGLLLALAACQSDEPGGSGIMQPPELLTDQVIIAHRGASGHAPENTMAAYDLAIEMGAEYIEQDVLPTADGVLVCIHDNMLDRTARGPAENCTGSVGSKTLAQLKTCDMGSWFNEAYPERASEDYVGLKIPTLEEVFQRYGGDANYYIEIKPNLATGTNVPSSLLDLIKQYHLYDGMVERHQVLVQSFVPTSLLAMNLLDPQVPLIQLSLGGTALSMPVFSTYAMGVGVPSDETSEQLVSQAHALGMAIHPYTVNGEADLAAIAALCVDGIFTNYPDRYRHILAIEDFSCPVPIR